MEKTLNKQNDKEIMLSHPRKPTNWCLVSNEVINLVWLRVSYDGVISLHFCEKGIKTAARNYQRDILTNVVEPLNQIDHGYSNRTLHLRIMPKLCNSGLKIMYPNLLVVTIGCQPGQTLMHSSTNCGQL